MHTGDVSLPPLSLLLLIRLVRPFLFFFLLPIQVMDHKARDSWIEQYDSALNQCSHAYW